ncbi:MAG: hypothetical protein U1F36_11590 [Planctomycetota bacterium]
MIAPQGRLPGTRSLWVLVALAAVVLLPAALRAEFLNFDDNRFFGPQSEIAAAGLWGVLDPTRTIAEVYLPVTHLLFALERTVFGDSALVPHLISLLLHGAVAAVLMRLLARCGLSVVAATAAAGLFLVHPALVESSLWVSGQKDLLSGLFTLLALGVLLRHADGELTTLRATGMGVLWALLAIYAKASAMVLAPLALLVVWGRVPPGGRRRPGPALAVLLVIALGTLHHTLIASAAGTMAPTGGVLARLPQVPGAFEHYLRTAVWPTGLDVLYPEVKTLEAFRDNLVFGLVAIAAVLVAIFVARRRAPRVAIGLCAFVIAWLPFNTALPASVIAAADRYLYLAIPGAVLALAAVPRFGTGLLIVALLPMGWMARERTHAFESSEALWNASLDRDRDNSVALRNLASKRFVDVLSGSRSESAMKDIEDLLVEAVDAARYPQHKLLAATELVGVSEMNNEPERAARYAAIAADAADAIDPLQPGALYKRLDAHLLAARYARRNDDVAAAQRHFEAARSIAPEDPSVLAFAAAKMQADVMKPDGSVDPASPVAKDALSMLDRAAKLAEQSRRVDRLYDVEWTRGLWLRAIGNAFDAEVALARAVKLDPVRVEAWIARCDLFLAQPELAAQAEQIARDGIKSVGERDAAPLQYRLALALGAQGRLDDARAYYEAALLLRPHDPQIRSALAAVLGAIGVRDLFTAKPDVLERIAGRVLELDPTSPKGTLIRAVALRGQKRVVDALILLDRCRESMPDDREVLQLHADTLRDRGWQLFLDPKEREACWNYFARYLAEAPVGSDTEAVHDLVVREWTRRYEEGQQALIDRDVKRAERALRLCLELRPDISAPCLQLGMALLLRDSETATTEEALKCFERAGEEQRRSGRDRGLPVFYAMTALRRLGRLDELQRLGQDYLAAPGDDTDQSVLDRIRALLQG